MSPKFAQKTRTVLLCFGLLFLTFGSLSQSAPLLWLAGFCVVGLVSLVVIRPEFLVYNKDKEIYEDWVDYDNAAHADYKQYAQRIVDENLLINSRVNQLIAAGWDKSEAEQTVIEQREQELMGC